MSSRVVYVRVAPSDVVPATLRDDLIVSDVPDGTLLHNVHALTELVGDPSPAARDLFTFAGAVYLADKKTPRSWAVDAWTRDFEVRMPVADVARWERACPALQDALTFLTGDRWRLKFRRGTERAPRSRNADISYEAVHLFSGGLDSLIGAINALAGGDCILLVGHHDSTMTEGPQKTLAAALSDEYADLTEFVPVRVKANSRATSYALPPGKENSTRSRSLVFIAMGLVAASALGPDVPLRIPENGLIALNVPLVSERSGSCSTRTTHPYFLARLREALDALGIRNPLENPYLLLTKGEMLDQCSNASLVRRIAPDSVSCAHSEQARWAGLAGFEKNCGYCYPCIIRRASLHAIGEDRFTGHYRIDACTKSGFVYEPVRGRDLRAVLSAIGAPRERLAPLLSGPVPQTVTIEELSDLHRRGLDELHALFADKGSRQIKAYADIDV
jgi:hypothetical protein